MSLIPFGFWAASGGGGGGAYDLLETTTLATSASSVTFSGLGSYSDYAHLQIRGVVRGDTAGGFYGAQIQFNGDTGTNYVAHRLSGTGSSVTSTALTPRNSLFAVDHGGSTTTSNSFGVGITDILDFSNTSKNTTTRTLTGQVDNLATRINLYSGVWLDTSAITSISIKAQGSSDFVAGSRFSLFGIKGA